MCTGPFHSLKRRLLLECELTGQSTCYVHPSVHTSCGLALSPTTGASGGGRLALANALVPWQLSHVFSVETECVDTGNGYTCLYFVQLS